MPIASTQACQALAGSNLSELKRVENTEIEDLKITPNFSSASDETRAQLP
jgi:hypothetical protein